MHRRDLTFEECQMVLYLNIFLKHKQGGKIKGQKIAEGNKQRTYITKEYSSSPTVSRKSVLLTSIIGANKNRNFSVIDTPNAFIQARVGEKVHGNN